MKILVIDNNHEFLNAWVGLLRRFGHNCTPLTTIEGQVVADVHASHWDLVLVDKRLNDDLDEHDETGQIFAVELSQLGTPTVLVTAFPPLDQALFHLLWTGAISGIADKSIDMLELAKCVDEFQRSQRFPNCVARFRWSDDAQDGRFSAEDWQRVRGMLTPPIGDRADVAVLFRSLVPPFAHTVELQPISPGHGGTSLFRARVSSGDGPVAEEVAIKFGPSATIRREAERYDRYAGPLPDGVAAHLRWRKETKLLGALAYSWVGDSIEDGVQFGPIEQKPNVLSWRRRRVALDRLFSVSLDPWYRVYRSESGKAVRPNTLLEYYTGPEGILRELPFADGRLPTGIPSPVTRQDQFWDFGSYGRFIDPTVWLTKEDCKNVLLKKYCPCHGDLHVKDIFVLPDDSPRLIDFGDTGAGHVFRDFAALEASIRLTCCNVTDLAALKDATNLIASVSSLGAYINYRAIKNPAYSDLRETLRAVTQIRRAALDAAGAGETAVVLKEYLFALVLRLLRYASGTVDEAPNNQSASDKSVICWHALHACASAAQQGDLL